MHSHSTIACAKQIRTHAVVPCVPMRYASHKSGGWREMEPHEMGQAKCVPRRGGWDDEPEFVSLCWLKPVALACENVSASNNNNK